MSARQIGFELLDKGPSIDVERTLCCMWDRGTELVCMSSSVEEEEEIPCRQQGLLLEPHCALGRVKPS